MNAPAARPAPPLGELIARLSALHPERIDLGLERMQRLLERLDHPERKLPPVIHVAGTNGKGSTIAYLRAILEAAGLRVHVYTSPSLVRINERFRLGRPAAAFSSAMTSSTPRSKTASAPMRARRSPFSKSKPRRRSVCSRSIRRMCCCSKSVSAGV